MGLTVWMMLLPLMMMVMMMMMMMMTIEQTVPLRWMD